LDSWSGPGRCRTPAAGTSITEEHPEIEDWYEGPADQPSGKPRRGKGGKMLQISDKPAYTGKDALSAIEVMPRFRPVGEDWLTKSSDIDKAFMIG
jgi:hypothetical protein